MVLLYFWSNKCALESSFKWHSIQFFHGYRFCRVLYGQFLYDLYVLLTWGWTTVRLGRLRLSWVSWVAEFIVLIVPVVLIKVVWSGYSPGLVIVVRLWRVVKRATVSILCYRTSIAHVRWRGRGVITMKVWWGRQPMTLSAWHSRGVRGGALRMKLLGTLTSPTDPEEYAPAPDTPAGTGSTNGGSRRRNVGCRINEGIKSGTNHEGEAEG